MFNLAKIYYDEENKEGLKEHKKSIKLLDSFALGFAPSAFFFFLILLKRFKNINLIMIEKELQKVSIESPNLANILYKQYLSYQYWLCDESYRENSLNLILRYDIICINFKIMFTDKLGIDKKKTV